MIYVSSNQCYCSTKIRVDTTGVGATYEVLLRETLFGLRLILNKYIFQWK